MKKNLDNISICIVIPFYNASKQISKVISQIPEFVNYVVIIDDCSLEELPKNEIISNINPFSKVFFTKTEINSGVGGATKIGFLKSIELDSDITIKVDADNQMDLSYLKHLIFPILNKEAEMCKGNRFSDFLALSKMPFIRRFGNLALSFLIKIATGYWSNFDPTNGFFAIKTKELKNIKFKNLSNRYYFETSLLSELYFYKNRIKDVPMPAIYGDEKSNMNIFKMPFLFGKNLTKTFVKRIIKEYFLYNFSIASVYILFGFPLFLFGFFYGIYCWNYYNRLNIYAPTGTIMLITLSIIIGFQLILQAIQYDIENSPKTKFKR